MELDLAEERVRLMENLAVCSAEMMNLFLDQVDQFERDYLSKILDLSGKMRNLWEELDRLENFCGKNTVWFEEMKKELQKLLVEDAERCRFSFHKLPVRGGMNDLLPRKLESAREELEKTRGQLKEITNVKNNSASVMTPELEKQREKLPVLLKEMNDRNLLAEFDHAREKRAAIESVGGVGGRYYCSPPFFGSIDILKLLGGETGLTEVVSPRRREPGINCGVFSPKTLNDFFLQLPTHRKFGCVVDFCALFFFFLLDSQVFPP